MTRAEWKKVLPIVQAFAEGETVQVNEGVCWKDLNDPSFEIDKYEYRIKPESKTRPFKNIDELIEVFCWGKNAYSRPLIWIENLFTEEVELIIGFNYANGFHDDDRVRTVSRELTMEDLYREYRFLNGDICGVKE